MAEASAAELEDVSAAVREQAEQAAARQQAAAEERLRAARDGQKVRRHIHALNNDRPRSPGSRCPGLRSAAAHLGVGVARTPTCIPMCLPRLKLTRCLSSAAQKAAAAADRASQEAARLREQLAELQRAVDAANPTAATTAASQVCRTHPRAGLRRNSCASSDSTSPAVATATVASNLPMCMLQS